MALTENQKRLIQAITQNNISLARRYAVSCLEEDTTAKNERFCSKYKSILSKTGIELPHDLEGILCVEDVSNSFKEGRYYLSSREEEVYENILLMKKVNEKLTEKGIQYLNSILLHGESGTGKTTFGRYVSYKTGLPFCYLNFSSLINSHLGGTAKNISKAFSYAITNPCILMLDEIDCISIERAGAGSNGSTDGEMARITITLMQEFDKIANDIIVIGATNRIDRIDDALLRRFSLKHEVEALSSIEKADMVNRYLSDVGMIFTKDEIISLIKKNENQAILLNELIRMISAQIANELVSPQEGGV